MNSRRRLSVFFGLLLVITAMVACASGTTPTASPSPKTTTTTLSPVAKTTAPSTSATATPTAKPATTTATPSAVSFAGKTVSLVVPYAPGGGGDVLGRVIALHLPKYLPGNPAIIVRNMPGGGATIGTNYVYAAKPDGLTILLTGGSIPLHPLLGTSGVKYELLKMGVLLGFPQSAVYIGRPGVISKPEDLPNAKNLIFGGTTGAHSQIFVIIKEMMNLNVSKMVFAYTGVGDVRRAFLSGEISVAYESTGGWNDMGAELAAKGDLIPLWQAGSLDAKGEVVKAPGIPASILTTKELYEKINGKAPSGMAWDALKGWMAAGYTFEKLLLTPPATPDRILRAYWDATDRMRKDPKFIEVFGSLIGKDAIIEGGEAYADFFRKSYAVKPEVADWVRTALSKYGFVN